MIRRAELRDIDYLMELLHQVNDIHAAGRPDIFIKGKTKYSAEEVSNIISNPDTPIFVHESEVGGVNGYCFCIVQDHAHYAHLAPVKTLYIDDLCVDAGCRGAHIGSQLYDYVKDYAVANNFYNITLNVWSCNPDAIRFYESLGLVPQKIGMEEILM